MRGLNECGRALGPRPLPAPLYIGWTPKRPTSYALERPVPS